MKRIILCLSLYMAIAWFATPSLYAQYFVKGTITTSDNGLALEYATLSLLHARDSSLVAGVVSNSQGSFQLEAEEGEYVLMASFLGYTPYYSSPFTLDMYAPSKTFAKMALEPVATTLDEVEIKGEKSTMVLSLDKRVFNVGQDLSNAGANASEILSNIPSITVDPEGNVKLRGNSEVRILVDGKPSGLINKGGKGLQQLQGSLIESVEVITNPSARYEAEGSAGIINIVLKKERKEGFNGSFQAILGQPNNFGASANINYRYKKVNFFLNYGIAFREEPNIGSVYQELYAGIRPLSNFNPGQEIEKALITISKAGLIIFSMTVTFSRPPTAFEELMGHVKQTFDMKTM